MTRGRVISDSGSFFHVSDWFPTILSATERSAGGPYREQPTDKPQLPLDGLSAWAALSSADRPLPRSSMIIRAPIHVLVRRDSSLNPELVSRACRVRRGAAPGSGQRPDTGHDPGVPHESRGTER